jgi:hypothetical protein
MPKQAIRTYSKVTRPSVPMYREWQSEMSDRRCFRGGSLGRHQAF